MKKMAKLLLAFFFAAVILWGCGKTAENDPLCAVVTGVDISFQYKDTLLRRHYTDEQKMRSVLLYLRLLKPLGNANNETVPPEEDIYEIVVHLSDGSVKHYRQVKHRYLSRPDRPWVRIDPSQAAQLYRLMRHLPSDAAV